LFFTKEGLRDVAEQLDALKHDYLSKEDRGVFHQTISFRVIDGYSIHWDVMTGIILVGDKETTGSGM
jgi:hypothetical protein